MELVLEVAHPGGGGEHLGGRAGEYLARACERCVGQALVQHTKTTMLCSMGSHLGFSKASPTFKDPLCV